MNSLAWFYFYLCVFICFIFLAIYQKKKLHWVSNKNSYLAKNTKYFWNLSFVLVYVFCSVLVLFVLLYFVWFCFFLVWFGLVCFVLFYLVLFCLVWFGLVGVWLVFGLF
jgi:hypothetical protein